MITIHYFASVREALSREREQLDLPAGVESVGQLIEHLSNEDAAFARLAGGDNKLLVAVNQTMADHEQGLSANDEVAFFPPMTGG